jgi:hypothetical protein
MGIFGASLNWHMHYICELGQKMSQNEEALSIKEIFGHLFATWKCSRYDWLGKWKLCI